MSQLVACLLLSSMLLSAKAVQAQRRHKPGQALLARPFRARYSRLPVPRDYFKPSHRAHYRYGPSYHAYYNRSPYHPHLYYHRRPSGRSPVATLRPRAAN